MQPQASNYAQRFSEYFERAIAQRAAKSLSDGAEIEIQVGLESFTFTKLGGKNAIKHERARDPQLIFVLTPGAADAILLDPSEDIGPIGVNIAKMIITPDADKNVSVQFKAGFLSLFSKGYFGVITAGGSEFASYLASKGLSGMGAIKDVLRKMKS